MLTAIDGKQIIEVAKTMNYKPLNEYFAQNGGYDEEKANRLVILRKSMVKFGESKFLRYLNVLDYSRFLNPMLNR